MCTDAIKKSSYAVHIVVHNTFIAKSLQMIACILQTADELLKLTAVNQTSKCISMHISSIKHTDKKYKYKHMHANYSASINGSRTVPNPHI